MTLPQDRWQSVRPMTIHPRRTIGMSWKSGLMLRQPTYFVQALCLTMIAVLVGCSTPSLDMAGGPIVPAGPDGGVVIGSVLVQAEQDAPDSWFNQLFGRKAAGFTYQFEILRVQATDPKGRHPYLARYELDAKPGEERIFVARLPVGTYLFKTFHHEGLSAMGGDVGVNFSVAPETTVYIGRLVLDLPGRVAMGTSYTYQVQDARETTLAVIQNQYPHLSQRVVNAPMQTR
ncbi:MAG: hypothetical protein P0119_15795 [Nitrospira sp.]|nr:hypothetical protein [Nitrospira sp.]